MNIVLLLDALSDQLAAGHAEFSGLRWFSTHQFTLPVLVHLHLVWCVHDTITSQNLAWLSNTTTTTIIPKREAKKSNSLAVIRLGSMVISYTDTFLFSPITYPGSLPCTQCSWVDKREVSSTHRVAESWNWWALLPTHDKTGVYY